MGLRDVLMGDAKKAAVVSDCCALIDDEVHGKSGLGGFAVKAGYGAVKGIKPGFVKDVVEKLMPEFCDALDAIWDEGVQKGNAESHLLASRGRVADALLGVTDAKSKNAKSALVKGTYEKLRGSAKKHVEEAVPRLAKLIAKHRSSP